MSFKLPTDSKLLSPNFIFGAATAAFQIEGANQEDGRCESIWDRFCATPGRVLNGDDGSVACDHYHRLDEDLDLIQSLGFEAYRFSVAWPRIEPKPGEWNEKGFEFYQRLIDGLLARGIQPYLTLYHWDLPQYLEDRGGWVNRDTAYRFAEYANKITERFGDKVASYATFNEPWCSSFLSYRIGEHAPGYQDDRLAYQVAHHLLLAHGLAIPKMRANAPKAQHGIVLNFTPAYPETDSPEDKAAAQYADDDSGHWFIEPLMNGTYPNSVVSAHPEWMPTQMPGDLEIIQQPIDFVGVNYYTRGVIKAGKDGSPEGVPVDAPKTDIGWEIYPAGLTKQLLDLHRTYPNLPPMIITENGAADNTDINNGEIDDTMRTQYYEQHLNAVDQAIKEGADIRGYFAWSLMDNFEWAFGYSQRFGIVHVDYQTQVRTVKRSGKTWQAFNQARLTAK